MHQRLSQKLKFWESLHIPTFSPSRLYAYRAGRCGVYPRRFKYSPAVRIGTSITYFRRITSFTASRVRRAKPSFNRSGYLSVTAFCISFSRAPVSARPYPGGLPHSFTAIVFALFLLFFRLFRNGYIAWREQPAAAAISAGPPPFSLMRTITRRLSSSAVLLSFLPSCFSSLQKYYYFHDMSICILELFRNFSFWRTKGSTTTVEKQQKNRILSKNHGFLRDLKPTFGWQRTNRVLEQVHYRVSNLNHTFRAASPKTEVLGKPLITTQTRSVAEIGCVFFIRGGA
jgi:hypothetical protein